MRSLSQLFLQSLRSPQTQEHATFKEEFEKVKAEAYRMIIYMSAFPEVTGSTWTLFLPVRLILERWLHGLC